MLVRASNWALLEDKPISLSLPVSRHEWSMLLARHGTAEGSCETSIVGLVPLLEPSRTAPVLHLVQPKARGLFHQLHAKRVASVKPQCLDVPTQVVSGSRNAAPLSGNTQNDASCITRRPSFWVTISPNGVPAAFASNLRRPENTHTHTPWMTVQ